jgi:cell division transport system permease protein
MAFLAALAAGLVVMVADTAKDWQTDIRREITVRIKPHPQRDIETDIIRLTSMLTPLSSIETLRVIPREETVRTLSPWLGQGLNPEALPLPRLMALKLRNEQTSQEADLNLIRKVIASVPGASLDDHRGWSNRLSSMADTVTWIGGVLFLVVLSATALTVIFATRAAMADNRGVVEVLHFIGARDSFIAREFERHFLKLGLIGACLGSVVAGTGLTAAKAAAQSARSSPAGYQIQALFGSFEMTWHSLLALVAVALTVASVTSITSRAVVHKTLRDFDER